MRATELKTVYQYIHTDDKSDGVFIGEIDAIIPHKPGDQIGKFDRFDEIEFCSDNEYAMLYDDIPDAFEVESTVYSFSSDSVHNSLIHFVRLKKIGV